MMNIFSSNKASFVDFVSDVLMTFLYMSFIIFSIDINGVYIMIATTILIVAINMLKQNSLNFHIGTFHAYMLIFALYSIISSLWARDSAYAIEKGVTLLELLVVFSLLYACYYKASIERLLKIIMWAGLILGIYTVIFVGVDTLRETLQDEGRLENSFANINVIGMACCSSIIIALYFFKREKNKINLAFCIPSLFVVAGSGSRKALVMLILGILFIFLYQNKDKGSKFKFRKIIISLIALVVVFYIAAESGLFAGSLNRFDGLIASFTGEGEVDSSSALRSFYRLLGFTQLLKTPFLGMGMGNARLLAYASTGHDCYLHCNYAELAANGGVIGLILYYWIYIPILKKEWSASKYNFIAPLILVIVIIQLVMDYGAVTYYSKTTYFLLMVVMLHLNELKKIKQIR